MKKFCQYLSDQYQLVGQFYELFCVDFAGYCHYFRRLRLYQQDRASQKRQDNASDRCR